MAFQDLYNFSNTLDLPSKRNAIKAKLLEITKKEKLAITVSGHLNPKRTRGMFLSVDCDNNWVKQNGSDVVVISRDIWHKSDKGNYCWERFIITKEMMHLFDTPDEYSDTGEKFDEILSSLFMTYNGESIVVQSELKCFWRALACLCPEMKRQEFAQSVRQGNMTHLDVAYKLMIPEQYIGLLLSDKYELFLTNLIETEIFAY